MMHSVVVAALAGTAVVGMIGLAGNRAEARGDRPALEMAASVDQGAKLDDATIVAIFDAANTADIETGRLAGERGASKEVRALGASLARDHHAVRQQARDLAKKLGVTPTPPNPNPYAEAHARAMAALSARSGAEFDRAFLDHEIAFHEAVLTAVKETLLPAISNAEVRAFVVKIAPAFQAHLDMTRAMKKQLGY